MRAALKPPRQGWGLPLRWLELEEMAAGQLRGESCLLHPGRQRGEVGARGPLWGTARGVWLPQSEQAPGFGDSGRGHQMTCLDERRGMQRAPGDAESSRPC